MTLNLPSLARSAFLMALPLFLQWPPIDSLHAADTNRAAPIELTSPLDYQVFQRGTPAAGTLVIAGRRTVNIAEPAVIEVRLIGPGALNEWSPLIALASGQGEFQVGLVAPAGGWYRLEVRLKGQPVDSTAVTAIEHVGMGEVFVISGQSNSANHGEEKQSSRSGRAAAFTGQKWQPAHDPQPGASGSGGSFIPPFADALAGRLNVPIGIVATSAGGTSVREWLPKGTRFPNPPTVTTNVRQLDGGGEWESKGTLYDTFTSRMKKLGPGGFRAVLWHQGESDANQRDASRTLSGALYQKFLEQLIRDSRRSVGWNFPWFVAQVSYHSPEDTGSAEIRAAQAALWKSGIAVEGPDTDALTGDLRDGNGQGIHFSGRGLREHAARWVEKVAPWLERELEATSAPFKPRIHGPSPRLVFPETESFLVEGRPAFVFLPPPEKRQTPQPWIFYAPHLPGYPDGAERWMHEQFLAAGIAVAGIDVGEAYGSPKSHGAFEALHRELTAKRGFAAKPCVFGRSRGGLWVSSWAIAHPERVAGLIGIYPVFDFRTYPGLKNAAPAYDLAAREFEAQAAALNPIARMGVLARARVPAALIHGDVDTVVPLKENSEEFVRHYREAGVGNLVKLIVLRGQGHNFFEGFFQSEELVDFAIARARAGAGAKADRQ